MQKLSIIIFLLCLVVGCTEKPKNVEKLAEKIILQPDYREVTFPNNISPISFKVDKKAELYYIEIYCDNKIIYSNSSNNGEFVLPKRKWSKIKEYSEFEICIYTYNNNKWSSYEPIINYISISEIDRYLTYRLIPPGYELWDKMGIYQRDLTSFNEDVILDNDKTDGGCMNCHTYGNHTATNSMMHYRGKNGGTIIQKGAYIRKVKFNSSKKLLSEGTYPAWHPSTDFIAYSVNDISQYFHISGDKPVEVSDAKSDIILYDIKQEKVITDSLLFETTQLETFPEWSYDGKTLYYTAADKGSRDIMLDSIRYNLYAIDFDVNTRKFSNKRLLFDAAILNKSVSHAKVTKDNKYIVATISDYGNFLIWHKESDIMIYNIETKKWRIADEINSQFADSYHSFSSNGEWMVFSSRRDDGLYTRPYITKFNADLGEFTKPFLLPQKNVDYYNNLFYSYNVPNFSIDKFTSQRKFLEKAAQENP